MSGVDLFVIIFVLLILGFSLTVIIKNFRKGKCGGCYILKRYKKALLKCKAGKKI